jgi:hypothetical protein
MKNEKNVQRYKGSMDELGKIIWIEIAKKLAPMCITKPLDYICENILPLNEKTFKRRLADSHLWLLHELILLQRFLQSEILREEILKRFDITTF